MIFRDELQINGRKFIKTYSSKGLMIERDGVQYGEAIDPAEFKREYTETDIPIEGADE